MVRLLIGALCIVAAVAIAFAVSPGTFHRAALEIKPYLGFPTVEERLEAALPVFISEDAWDAASKDEKVGLLQAVADAEAKRWGIPAPYVGTEDFGWFGPHGIYRNEDNEIMFDAGYIDTIDGTEALRTCLHEGYHAYQWQVCEGLIPEPEPGKRELWKYEYDNSIWSIVVQSDDWESMTDEEQRNRYFEVYNSRDTENTTRQYAEDRMAYYLKSLGLSDKPVN